MGIKREEFVTDVAMAISDYKAALFVGAGVSASTGIPNWSTIMTPLANELGLEVSYETDLYKMAQYYENQKGRKAVVKAFERKINVINNKSDYLQATVDLGFHEIWTTNYDKVIETGLIEQGIIPKIISSDNNLNSFNDGGVNIYKMNGDISNPEDMVITQSDLEKYSETHKMMLTFIRRELISKSFLFIGYSFSDTLILDNIAKIRHCIGDACSTHYAILGKTKDTDYFVDDLEKRYKIRCLVLNSWDEFPKVIKDIKEKSIEHRVFISGAFDQLPTNEDEFADRLCDSLVNKLYDNEYIITTGMGKKVGNYLAGHAFAKLSQTNPYDIEKKLMMWPFFEKMSTNSKSNHRYKMIKNSHFVIFIFGNHIDNKGYSFISQGVLEEFKIAKELGRIIIPIPTTKYAARIIFQEVSSEITKYPYLERYIETLRTENDPDRLAEIVVRILDDCIKPTPVAL